MTNRSNVIAIDGPSGAGKGTVSRAVAKTLDCGHLDTGAMYRAVAWRTQQDGYAFDNDEAVAGVAARAVFVLNETRVIIDGHDVTVAIRTGEMDKAAATVARLPRVREVLVAQQRAYAEKGVVVVEGRDIGTVVFPDAMVKIYLDAAPSERAARRAKDPAHGFSEVSDLAEIASAIAARDHIDRTREVSPLTLASDAVLIDTTGVAVEDVVSRVLGVVREKLKGA